MNMTFEAIVGLEMHIQLNTKSKMFSCAPVAVNEEPNSLVTPYDFAFPGTLPSVNKQAVIKAIKMSKSLHMNIDKTLCFDRKNYFYSDLSKGYQITQKAHPLGTSGYVNIYTDKLKRIEIESLHLEEDTCKQYHIGDYSYLDYNRSGIPLIEIVSAPVFRNGKEARAYAEKIRQIAVYEGISDGKLENGSIRFDVNVSIKNIDSDSLGKKVEIKNLNSFLNIEKAIDFEIKKQTETILSGQEVESMTKRFDEKKQETVSMRFKTESIDYKFFPEPNIPPIDISDLFSLLKNEVDYSAVEDYLLNLGLEYPQVSSLFTSLPLLNMYVETVKLGANALITFNWINRDVRELMNKNGTANINSKHFNDFINLLDKGIISSKQGKDVFEKMVNENISPNDFIEADSQIHDESIIISLINQVIESHPNLRTDYKNGKTHAIGFVVGQVMKKSSGKVNPALTNKLVVKELSK